MLFTSWQLVAAASDPHPLRSSSSWNAKTKGPYAEWQCFPIGPRDPCCPRWGRGPGPTSCTRTSDKTAKTCRRDATGTKRPASADAQSPSGRHRAPSPSCTSRRAATDATRPPRCPTCPPGAGGGPDRPDWRPKSSSAADGPKTPGGPCCTRAASCK